MPDFEVLSAARSQFEQAIRALQESKGEHRLPELENLLRIKLDRFCGVRSYPRESMAHLHPSHGWHFSEHLQPFSRAKWDEWCDAYTNDATTRFATVLRDRCRVTRVLQVRVTEEQRSRISRATQDRCASSSVLDDGSWELAIMPREACVGVQVVGRWENNLDTVLVDATINTYHMSGALLMVLSEAEAEDAGPLETDLPSMLDSYLDAKPAIPLGNILLPLGPTGPTSSRSVTFSTMVGETGANCRGK